MQAIALFFFIFSLLSVVHVEKDVAKAIQAARQKLGITQKDLAAVIIIHSKVKLF
jgi:ribosome-binding protein aMBF1 (putative translation factor)